MSGPNGIGSRPCNAGWKARSSGRPTSRSEARLIPNPIRKVLSSIRAHRVRALLMGGQACVFYGAAEFNRDADLALVTDVGTACRCSFRENGESRAGVTGRGNRGMGAGAEI